MCPTTQRRLHCHKWCCPHRALIPSKGWDWQLGRQRSPVQPGIPLTGLPGSRGYWFNRHSQAVSQSLLPLISLLSKLTGTSSRIKVPVHVLHSCMPVVRQYGGSCFRRGI
eukprot:343142-Amphidinium_carterae.1